MKTLGQKQRAFTKMVAELILWAYKHGYELSMGDAYRDVRSHGKLGEKKAYGHPRSKHKQRLAVDLNLFIDGKYQSSTEAHRPLGQYWKKKGGTWGGDFPIKDGNHYSWGEKR